MKKEQKSELLNSFKASVIDAHLLVLLDFRGLKVSEANELRTKLRKVDSRLKVIKNTIARKAILNTPLQGLHKDFINPTAVAYTVQKHFESIKIIKDFQQAHPNIRVKAGIVDGFYLKADEVIKLLDIPTLELSLGKIMSSLQSPVRTIMSGLQAPLRNIASILKQYSEKSASSN